MRIALPKLFAQKQKWIFCPGDLIESINELDNPMRGWYRIFPFWAQEDVDTAVLSKNCKADADTLALVIINIGAYRENAICITFTCIRVSVTIRKSILIFFIELIDLSRNTSISCSR